MTEQDDQVLEPEPLDHAAIADHVQTFAQDCGFHEDFDGEDTQTLVEDPYDDNVSVWSAGLFNESLLRDPREISQWEHYHQWEDSNRREDGNPTKIDNESVNVDETDSVAGQLVLLTGSDIPRISSMFGHLEFDLLGIGRQFDSIMLRGVGGRIRPSDRTTLEPSTHESENCWKGKAANGMIDTHIEAFNKYCMMVGVEVSENPEAPNPLDLILSSKQPKETDCDPEMELIAGLKKLSIGDNEGGGYYVDAEGQSPPTRDNGTNLRDVRLSSTGSAMSPFNGSSAAEASGNGGESSDYPQLSNTERNRSNSSFGCRRLLCWHAANGIKCKEQVGRSPETRRLLSDHSFCNRYNTHRLPDACTGCGVLYLEKEKADDHEALSSGGLACRRSEDSATAERNAALERIAISTIKHKKIKKALADFRKSRNGESPWLPDGCDPEHFQAWIKHNVPLYIAESNTVQEKAAQELGEWYVVFVTLFPGENIPPDPFTEPADGQHGRLLELIEGGLVNSTNNGLLPPFDQQQLAIFRNVVKVALCTLQSELLQQQCTKKKARSRPKKRKRPAKEANNTKDSSSDSRLSLTPFPSSTTSYGSPQYPDAKKWQQAAPYQAWSPPQNPENLQPNAMNLEIYEPHPMEASDFQSLFGLVEPTVLNDFDVNHSLPISDSAEGLTSYEHNLFQQNAFT